MSRKSLSFFLRPFPSSDSSYFLFSAEHFIDLANLFLLTVPILGLVFVFQIFLKLKRSDKWDATQRLLAYMSLSAIPFVFFVDPSIGAIRDWDLLSLASTPIVFSSVYFLLKKSPPGLKLAGVALPVLAFGLWHTGSWIYSNMDQRRAASLHIPRLLEDTHYTEDYHDGSRLVPLAVITNNCVNDDELAKSLAYKRLSIDSTDVVAMDVLQIIYSNSDDLDSASAILQKMVEQMPENEAYKLLQAITLVRAGRFAEACPILSGIEPTPNDYRRDFYLGTCYLNLQQYDSALAYFSEIQEDNPSIDLLNFNIAMSHCGLRDFPQGLKYLRIADSLSPRNPEVLTQIGNTYQSMKLYDSAEVYYRRVLSLDAQRFDAHSALAFLYMDTGRLEESLNWWRRCIRLNPQFVEGYFFIGKVLKDLGKIEEALNVWNTTLALQPAFTPALYQSALLYEELDQVDSVISRLQRIAEIDTVAAESDPEISKKLREYGIERP
jgi:tetratricopeptide (TPR) repeat protein